MISIKKSLVYQVGIIAVLIILTHSCENFFSSSYIDYTLQKGTVTDVEGNIYNTIGIGTQIWMTENLKTTRFNDSTPIPYVTEDSEWADFSVPGPKYCWYNNDSAKYKNTYGALYNWYTVETGLLCPTGWHVPCQSEWTTLTTFLGGTDIAGSRLKESGTTHWKNPNEGATNVTRFTALPGGYRHRTGIFKGLGYVGYWWTRREEGVYGAWNMRMHYDSPVLFRSFYNKRYGFSVRCIKTKDQ